MTIVASATASSLQRIINLLGNTISVYTYSSATKSENEEGDVTVTSWGSATSSKCIDGTNQKVEETFANQGTETIGDDEIVVRDDLAVAQKDRIDKDSQSYRVVGIRPIRYLDTDVAQIVTLVRVDDTTNWA